MGGTGFATQGTAPPGRSTVTHVDTPPCGEGVWMRIGYFDMGGNLAECPEPLERFAVNGRWYCRRTARGCTSVHFSALGKDYTAVCGMVEG